MTTEVFSLRQLLPSAGFAGCSDVLFSRVSADSRQISPGDLFVALRGSHADGHNFIQQAIRSNATAVLLENEIPGLNIPQAVVSNSRQAYARLCMAMAGNPHRQLTLAGITGTNGKSTTCWLLRSILQQARFRCGLTGTIECHDGLQAQPVTLTTPAPEVMASLMSDMVRNGCHHGVVEISSHALDQHRCTALQLSVAAITNVTQDHFDYHQSAGSYRAAKALIANLLHCDAPLLLNADDPGCQQLVRDSSIHAPIIWYGTTDQAELQADLITRTHRSQRIKLRLAQGSAEVRLRLIGQHNVSNALAAAAMAEQLGIEISSIVAGLESVSCIPGRMQRIDEGQPFQVLVDYAHTPDAISRCLQTVRQFTPGRLHCVFGAGGDRDRSKRPLMAAAASVADVVYVTSDNPRTEDPWQIIRDVEAGFDQGQSYICEVDRRSAIKQAFETAEPGDVVVIAGRGHEQVQVVGTQQHTFDDRQVARLLLNEIFDNAQVAGIRRFFSTVRSS